MMITIVLGAALSVAPAAPAIPVETAARVLQEAHLAALEDGGRLWGRSLDGPLLLVDPDTRFVVANRADGKGVLEARGGAFVGQLPSSVIIANTSIEWNDVRWTMVMWPSLGDVLVQRRRLLMHECWHRIQLDLGFPMANGNSEHLATLEGRYLFLLELRALATALRTDGEQQKAAIRDALVFRGARRAAFPAASASERALENNEGLAEYTGFALRGTGAEESRLAVARRLDGAESDSSFMRSFAYQTGPAYGLLLDALDASWRKSYRANGDLDDAVRVAAKIALPHEVVELATDRAASYRGAQLRASEESRDRERQVRLAKLRAALVDGPTLCLPIVGANYGFDPNGVVPLPGVGTVYQPLDVTAPWGDLHTTAGVLVTADSSRMVVSAPAETKGSTLAGVGWTLTLKPGWTTAPGMRPGDLQVIHP
jgi:hypothetical protein